VDNPVSALARACELTDRAARWQLGGEHHFTTPSRLELASPIDKGFVLTKSYIFILFYVL